MDLLLIHSERRAIYRGDGSGTESTENEVKAIADFPLIEAEEARFSLLYAQAAPIWREA